MSDYLYQDYPPLPSVLWSIYRERPKFKSQKSLETNIKKAFRLYIEIISLYEQIPDFYLNLETNFFTNAEWLKKAENSNWSQVKSYKERNLEDWLSLFPITKKVWLEDFIKEFSKEFSLTQEIEQQSILNIKPFEGKSERKNIENDLKILI